MVVPETHSIVIVDDVPEIREILGFLLEESGWFRVVGQAGTGEEAIAVAAKTQPEIVLLDLDLPGMSGLETLPLLREQVPDAAIVILSGAVEGSPGGESHPRADAVVEKGVSNRQLIDRLLGVVRPSPSPAPAAAEPRQVQIDDAGAWLAAVVDSSLDPVIGTLLDGTTVSWSPAAERLFGYAAHEIIGRSVATVLPADRLDEMQRILDEVGRGGRVDNLETVRVHKDGSRVDVQLTVAPVFDHAGAVVGASAVARDVTNRRRTEAALARAIAQLERRNKELARSNEELDSFASVASHDLAQPLQVAYGFLEMLRSEFGDAIPEPGRGWLDNSVASLERMRDLVRDILRYARTGSGETKREWVDIAGVVEDALAGLAVALEDRRAAVDVAKPLPPVVGDSGQLTLVLQNLIANAIKFVPQDRRPYVRVTGERKDGEVVVRVADNGIGIDPDLRDRVFEMFHRADGPASTFAGTGLGLAIVKKIVVRHGGGVWIDDGIDGGVTVALRLPSAGDLA